jgi:Acyl-CoA carboxylase epsilon subunit
VITVVRGSPTPAELAALMAVLLAAGSVPEPSSTGAAASAVPARTPVWTDWSRALCVLPRPGARAWRVSALPR